MKRNHELYVGEVVFDVDMQYWGIIVELGENTAKLDMNGRAKDDIVPIGWCEMENRKMFDEEIDDGELVWECNRLSSLYQIAWGVKDGRTENIVCYEHNEIEDEYSYYSPYLDENLFTFECNIR